jgi:hypothetical protein
VNYKRVIAALTVLDGIQCRPETASRLVLRLLELLLNKVEELVS